MAQYLVDIDQEDIDLEDIDQADIDQADIDQEDIDQADIDQADIDQENIDQEDIDQKGTWVPSKHQEIAKLKPKSFSRTFRTKKHENDSRVKNPNIRYLSQGFSLNP
jgi:hypothetical protein